MILGADTPFVPFAKKGYRDFDVTGQRFGFLVALGIDQVRSKPGVVRRWICKCDCGNLTSVTTACLRSMGSNKVTSCGCWREKILAARAFPRKHGKTETPEFMAWAAIRDRCRRPAHPYYHRYGGRGIKICAGWNDDFSSFLADVGERPSNDLSIDRKNNDGHYSCGKCEECRANGWPMNCRWATQKQQMRNRENSRRFTFNGITKVLSEWAEEAHVKTGVNNNTFRKRIDRGLSLEIAMQP